MILIVGRLSDIVRPICNFFLKSKESYLAPAQIVICLVQYKTIPATTAFVSTVVTFADGAILIVKIVISDIFSSFEWNWKTRVLLSLTCAIIDWWIIWGHDWVVKFGLQLLLVAEILRCVYFASSQSHICYFFRAMVKMLLNNLLCRYCLLQEILDDVHAEQAAFLRFAGIKPQSLLVSCDIFAYHEDLGMTLAYFVIQFIKFLFERADGGLRLIGRTEAFLLNTL